MDLVKDPVNKLIKQIAVPTSIGFFFHTMYNVADTYFAGMLSLDALSALSISFPVYFMILSLAIGVSQAATALLSNAIGENNEDATQKLIYQSLSFTIIMSVILTVVGFAVCPWLFKFLGATEQYLTTTLNYMNTILFGALFFLLQDVLNAILTARGNTKPFRNILIISFFANIVLNPIFMFGLIGFPKMGIFGLAFSTILIQFFGCFFLFLHVAKDPGWCGFKLNLFKPNKKIYKDIFKQAYPASFNMLTVSLGIFIITYFISRFGKTEVAAYGIATRIEQIILLPAIGLNSAMLSIAGQNNGAKLFDRIRLTWYKSLKYASVIMLFGGVIMYFANHWMMGLFTKDPSVIESGHRYLEIASFVLPVYAYMFITISMLQGLKKPLYALYIGFTRQIIAPIIVFPLLSTFFAMGIIGIWRGVFIINWVGCFLTLYFGYTQLKKLSDTSKSENQTTKEGAL